MGPGADEVMFPGLVVTECLGDDADGQPVTVIRSDGMIGIAAVLLGEQVCVHVGEPLAAPAGVFEECRGFED